MTEKTPEFRVQPFGGYYLLQKIAVGGMAELFKAKQIGVRGFEKIVVIKKILQHLGSDPEFVEMFEDEAKIAAQLHHSNIVQIYELGEVDQTLYITMEYVEGKNVRDITKAIAAQGVHLSVEQSVYLISEVLKGLDYAHRKTDSDSKPLEIIHRDMSPQNIIVSYEGEVKILDFGIAKAASQLSHTEAGVLKGKFSYMSPEQASGKRVTQHTDIYACGVILHELLTSKRLFRSQSDMETLDRVKSGEVVAPSSHNKAIPAELDRIVLKALSKDITERYQTSGEFLNDLLAFFYAQKFNYSSQDLSIFMRTLFEESIQKEQRNLQEALKSVPTRASDPIQSAKTHIAFKFDPQKNEVQDQIQNQQTNEREELPSHLRETTISTRPPRRSRAKILALVVSLLIIAALLSFVPTSDPEQAAKKPQPAQTEAETETIDPQAPLPTEELFEEEEEENPAPPAAAKPAPPVEEKPVQKLPPPKTPLEVFEEIPREAEMAKKEAPSEKPGEAPAEAPKVEASPETTESAPEEPPKPASGTGIIDMVAPIEGFAKLFVNNEDYGTVPGRRARGINLEAGTHFIRCETNNRVYSGKITLKKDQRLTIRCGDLRN